MKTNTNSIASAFSQAESQKASKLFLTATDHTLSYAALCERVRRLAGLLAEIGVKSGDRVIYATQDDELAALIFIGLLRTGITAVFLDPDTRTKRAEALIKFVQPAALLLDDDLCATWGQKPDCPLIAICKPKPVSALQRLLGRAGPDDSFLACLNAAVPAPLPDEIDPDLTAYILFTSGTTSQPKGVCITHAALNAHLNTLGQVYLLSDQSRILNPLILSHADGMIQGPVLAFFHGATWCRPFRFRVQLIEDLLDIAYRERVTHVILVPTILALLNRFASADNDSFRHPGFRWVVSCGAALDTPVWETFERLFGVSIINVYGLTETIAGGLFAGHNPGESHHGTVGRPVDCSIRIVDDNGQDVRPGEKGELLMKGSLLMHGYFRAPEATAEVLSNGWLRTGDIARTNREGLIEIVGRRKNIIISGGINIHPEEVDQVLQAFPGVIETATLSRQDPMWGEIIISAVVLEPACQADDRALSAHCRHHLEESKVPAEIHFFETLPRGRSGKILLPELREQIDSRRVPSPTICSGGETEARILAIAAASFKVPPDRVSLSSTTDAIPEWDSLAHLSLIAEAEKAFGICFSPTDVIRIKTLGDVVTTVQRLLEQKPT